MNNDKENIIYTAKDIEAYLTGKLSPAEMHALEKAALDDPFLAEAIEGYENMETGKWKHELAALKMQFREAAPTAKLVQVNRSRTRWWKAAAAVLVIGTGTLITYLLTKEKTVPGPQQQIAQNIIKQNTADSNKTDLPVTANGNIPAFKEKEQVLISPVANEKNAGLVSVPVQNNYTPIKDFTLANADSLSTGKSEQKPIQEIVKTEEPGRVADEEKAKPDAAVQMNAVTPTPDTWAATGKEKLKVSAKAAGAKQTAITRKADFGKNEALNNMQEFKTAATTRNFIAQVVGPDNSPLPFANVTVTSANFGTYADVKGNFRLVSPDSLIQVEVKSIGYLPRQYTLRSNVLQNKIVLSEDETALREKTVARDNNNAAMASGNINRRAILLKDSVQNVEPADGWDNYNTYISNNIEIPADILKKQAHGELEINFDVKSNGAISNIKVGESGCDPCKEAAKRLIEQGPQWKVKKGRKASARIKVQF